MNVLRILTCALGSLAISVFAVACGDDDEDTAATTTAAASAETVNVTGEDFSYDLSATPTTETKEITFENAGKQPHEVLFARINEGYTLQDAIDAKGKKGTAEMIGRTFAEPGKEGKPIEIDQPLEPGHYAMLCAIPFKGTPHYELGMQEEFDITG